MAAAQSFVRQVAAQLTHRLRHRLLHLLRRHGRVGAFAPLQVLDLDHVAAGHVRVLRPERLQIEIRVALVQLVFRVQQKVAHQTEVGGHECVHDLLAVDVVANPRLVADGGAQKLQGRPPLAVVGHVAHQAREVVHVDREHAHVLVGVAQVAVHQPPDRLVGNAQPRHAAGGAADAEQPEVVQQGQEVLALNQAV